MIRDINKRHTAIQTHNSGKDLHHRFCTHCYLQLVYDERNDIFKCPRCNVSTTIVNTQPSTGIRTNFPTFSPTQSTKNKTHIAQAPNESLPRSEQFIRSRLADKNKHEDNDPYLQILKQNNQIRITNIEYYDPEDNNV